MTYRVHVRVMPRQGLLDPQGQAVGRALSALGFDEVSSVHVGKAIEVEVTAATPEAARDRVRAMCDKLLANPVIEDFDIEVDPS